MKATHKKQLLMVSALCLAMAPFAVSAQDYLKGQTSYKPSDSADNFKGDMPQDFEYTAGSSGDLAKRQRVESRVDAYMKQITNDEVAYESLDAMTPQEFQQLVTKAQGGDALAIGGVGYALQNGLGTEKNEQQAIDWYKRAIDYGQTQYYTEIGKMYREEGKQDKGFFKSMVSGGNGSTVTDNNEEARKWFEKGVYSGDWQGYLMMAQMYRDGAGGVQKDMDKANWYHKEGMKRKNRHDELLMKEVEQRARAVAEADEGLRSGREPAVGWKAQENLEVQPSVMLGDNYCTLLETDAGTQFSASYKAYCAGIGPEETRVTPSNVLVKGADCTVYSAPANTQGQSFELRCK